MRLRQIEGNELPSAAPRLSAVGVARALAFAAGQNLLHHFRVKLFLRAEMIVEAAAREPRIGHDLVDRNTVESVPVEEAPRGVDDLLPRSLLMFFGVWH